MKVLPIIAMLGLLFVPGASAATPSSIVVQAERLNPPSRQEAVVRIELNSGPGTAAFGFEYELPTWPMPRGIVGSPIQIRSVEMTGAGSLRPAKSGPVPSPVLKREHVCRRELTTPAASAYWVELPANSSSVIELQARSTFPSWPRTKYALRFSTFELDEPTAARTLLQTVGIPMLGHEGRRIDMHLVEHGVTHGRGRTPELVGGTNPPLRKGRISLRAVRETRSGSVILKQWSNPFPKTIYLGGVRTDKEGRFRLPSRTFPYAGKYSVIARSQAMGHIAADWNCSPFL